MWRRWQLELCLGQRDHRQRHRERGDGLYAATDANCVPTSSIEATTETVTLTRIGGTCT